MEEYVGAMTLLLLVIAAIAGLYAFQRRAAAARRASFAVSTGLWRTRSGWSWLGSGAGLCS